MGITDEPWTYGWGGPWKSAWKQGSEARKTWRGDPIDVSTVPGYSGHEVPDDRRRGGNNGDFSEAIPSVSSVLQSVVQGPVGGPSGCSDTRSSNWIENGKVLMEHVDAVCEGKKMYVPIPTKEDDVNDPRMNRAYDYLPSWATGVVRAGDQITVPRTTRTTEDLELPKIRGNNSTVPLNSSVAQKRARIMAEAAQVRGIQVLVNPDGSLPAWFVDMANNNFPSTGSEKITDSDFRRWVTGTVLSNPHVRLRVTREETQSTTMRVPDRGYRFPTLRLNMPSFLRRAPTLRLENPRTTERLGRDINTAPVFQSQTTRTKPKHKEKGRKTGKGNRSSERTEEANHFDGLSTRDAHFSGYKSDEIPGLHSEHNDANESSHQEIDTRPRTHTRTTDPLDYQWPHGGNFASSRWVDDPTPSSNHQILSSSRQDLNFIKASSTPNHNSSEYKWPKVGHYARNDKSASYKIRMTARYVHKFVKSATSRVVTSIKKTQIKPREASCREKLRNHWNEVVLEPCREIAAKEEFLLKDRQNRSTRFSKINIDPSNGKPLPDTGNTSIDATVLFPIQKHDECAKPNDSNGAILSEITDTNECVGGYDIHQDKLNTVSHQAETVDQARRVNNINSPEEDILFSTVDGYPYSVVRESDLLVLMDQQQMVGDEVIDNVLQLRINRYNSMQQNADRNFALVPSLICQVLRDDARFIASQSYDRNGRHYFFPIEDYEHWYLVHFDMATLTVTFYDSLNYSSNAAVRSRLRSVYIEPIINDIRLHQKHLPPASAWKMCQYVGSNLPLQPSGSIVCGLYLLQYAESILDSLRDNELIPNFPTHIPDRESRYDIAMEILGNARGGAGQVLLEDCNFNMNEVRQRLISRTEARRQRQTELNAQQNSKAKSAEVVEQSDYKTSYYKKQNDSEKKLEEKQSDSENKRHTERTIPALLDPIQLDVVTGTLLDRLVIPSQSGDISTPEDTFVVHSVEEFKQSLRAADFSPERSRLTPLPDLPPSLASSIFRGPEGWKHKSVFKAIHHALTGDVNGYKALQCLALFEYQHNLDIYQSWMPKDIDSFVEQVLEDDEYVLNVLDVISRALEREIIVFVNTSNFWYYTTAFNSQAKSSLHPILLEYSGTHFSPLFSNNTISGSTLANVQFDTNPNKCAKEFRTSLRVFDNKEIRRAKRIFWDNDFFNTSGNLIEKFRIVTSFQTGMKKCSSCENFAIHNCIHRSKENQKHFSGLVRLLKTCGTGNLTIQDFRKDMLDVKLKKSMKSSLSDFTPIKNIGDGNCFWTAVSTALVGDPILGRGLKRATLSYFQQNKADFKNYYEGEESERRTLEKLAFDGLWAASDEIFIVARMLKRRINVYSEGREYFYEFPEEDFLYPPINIYLKDDHFSPLIRNHLDVIPPSIRLGFYHPRTKRTKNIDVNQATIRDNQVTEDDSYETNSKNVEIRSDDELVNYLTSILNLSMGLSEETVISYLTEIYKCHDNVVVVPCLCFDLSEKRIESETRLSGHAEISDSANFFVVPCFLNNAWGVVNFDMEYDHIALKLPSSISLSHAGCWFEDLLFSVTNILPSKVSDKVSNSEAWMYRQQDSTADNFLLREIYESGYRRRCAIQQELREDIANVMLRKQLGSSNDETTYFRHDVLQRILSEKNALAILRAHMGLNVSIAQIESSLWIKNTVEFAKLLDIAKQDLIHCENIHERKKIIEGLLNKGSHSFVSKLINKFLKKEDTRKISRRLYQYQRNALRRKAICKMLASVPVESSLIQEYKDATNAKFGEIVNWELDSSDLLVLDIKVEPKNSPPANGEEITLTPEGIQQEASKEDNPNQITHTIEEYSTPNDAPETIIHEEGQPVNLEGPDVLENGGETEPDKISETKDDCNEKEGSESDLVFNEIGDLCDRYNLSREDLTKQPPKSFALYIPHEKFNQFFDDSKQQLTSGGMFQKVIADEMKKEISCSFSSKSGVRVHKKKGFAFWGTIYGHCRCGISFIIKIPNKPSEKTDTRLDVNVKGIREFIQGKYIGRPIKGKERKKIKLILNHQKAIRYRSELAKKPDPKSFLHGTLVPNAAVLHKIRSEITKDSRTSQDPEIDLQNLMTTWYNELNPDKNPRGFIQLANTRGNLNIHMYGYDGFSLARTYRRRKEIFTIHADATGGLFKQSSVKKALLYLAIGRTKETEDIPRVSWPLGEMINQRGNVTEISYFFSSLKDGIGGKGRVADIICVDFSYALIHAALGAFNTERIEDYHLRSWKALEEQKPWDDSKVFVFICTAHLVNAFKRNLSKKIDKKQASRRILDIALFGLSRLQESFSIEELQHFANLMIRLFGSPNMCPDEVESIVTMLKVRKDEANNDFLLPELDEVDAESPEDDDLPSELLAFATLKERSMFYQLFVGLRKEFQLELSDDSLPINPLYCPEVIDILAETYISMFPFWSASIIRNNLDGTFLRETSASIETEFRTKKHNWRSSVYPNYTDYVRDTYTYHIAKINLATRQLGVGLNPATESRKKKTSRLSRRRRKSTKLPVSQEGVGACDDPENSSQLHPEKSQTDTQQNNDYNLDSSNPPANIQQDIHMSSADNTLPRSGGDSFNKKRSSVKDCTKQGKSKKQPSKRLTNKKKHCAVRIPISIFRNIGINPTTHESQQPVALSPHIQSINIDPITPSRGQINQCDADIAKEGWCRRKDPTPSTRFADKKKFSSQKSMNRSTGTRVDRTDEEPQTPVIVGLEPVTENIDPDFSSASHRVEEYDFDHWCSLIHESGNQHSMGPSYITSSFARYSAQRFVLKAHMFPNIQSSTSYIIPVKMNEWWLLYINIPRRVARLFNFHPHPNVSAQNISEGVITEQIINPFLRGVGFNAQFTIRTELASTHNQYDRVEASGIFAMVYAERFLTGRILHENDINVNELICEVKARRRIAECLKRGQYQKHRD